MIFPKFALPLTICCLLSAATIASAQSTNRNTNRAPSTPAAAAAAAAKAKPLPFNGKLGAVDKVAKTITLDESTKRVFEINSETKIMKAEKPATLDDGVIGDEVRGSYKKMPDGKLIAVSIAFGGKTPPATKPAPKPATTMTNHMTNMSR